VEPPLLEPLTRRIELTAAYHLARSTDTGYQHLNLWLHGRSIHIPSARTTRVSESVFEPKRWASDVSALPRATRGARYRRYRLLSRASRREMGCHVLGQVGRRWQKERHKLGPCLVWRGQQYETARTGGSCDAALKRSEHAHRVVWRRLYGPIPLGDVGSRLQRDPLSAPGSP